MNHDMNNYGSIDDVFEEVCGESRQAPTHPCVSLYVDSQRYGGPEEGGWWRTVRTLESYRICPTIELAYMLKERIERIAKERTDEARRAYGEQCLREMEYCDERYIDDYDAFYGVPDGPDVFTVIVENVPGLHEYADSAVYE
jgi:hypothetical protein